VDKLWDLVERSVIFQGILVIMVTATVCALVLQGREVPEVLSVAFGGIIAYFFASKTQVGAVRHLEDKIRLLQTQERGGGEITDY
jgi:hypothetical protein